jgi:hypothetical protein
MPKKNISLEIITGNGGKSVSEGYLSIDTEDFEGIEAKEGCRILKFRGVTITVPEEICRLLSKKKI